MIRSSQRNEREVRNVEDNKKAPQVAGTTSEENVRNEKIKTTKKHRYSFQSLMAFMLSMNLIAVVHIVNSTQNTKQVNEEISELNEKQKQLNTRQEIFFEQQAEELERRKEIDNRITEILNRYQQEVGR